MNPISTWNGLLFATCLSFGNEFDSKPKTMQQSVFPNAHNSHGKTPAFFAVDVPTINEPAPAHVAAIEGAFQKGETSERRTQRFQCMIRILRV